MLAKVGQYDKELAVELRILLRMIERYVPKIGDTELPISKDESTDLIKPTPVIKKVFRENPDKQFSPGELRDMLKRLRQQKRLIVKSKDLLVTTHTVVRALLKQEFVIKIDKPDGIPVYQLANKENELLI